MVLGPLALRRPERPGVEVLPPELQPREPEAELEPEEESEPDVEEVEPEPASAAAALGVADLGLLLDPEDAVRVEGDRRIALRSAGEAPLERLAEALDLGGDDGPRTVAVAGASDRGGSVAVAAADRRRRGGPGDAGRSWSTRTSRRPALARAARARGGSGPRDYLVGEASPRDVLRTRAARASTAARSARWSASRRAPGGGDEDGVEGPRFEGLVERLPRVYDLVVFAAPPLTADRGGAMPQLADESILVAGRRARAGRAGGRGRPRRSRDQACGPGRDRPVRA